MRLLLMRYILLYPCFSSPFYSVSYITVFHRFQLILLYHHTSWIKPNWFIIKHAQIILSNHVEAMIQKSHEHLQTNFNYIPSLLFCFKYSCFPNNAERTRPRRHAPWNIPSFWMFFPWFIPLKCHDSIDWFEEKKKENPRFSHEIFGTFNCKFYRFINQSNCRIKLVGGFNTSEKYESQLGWWNSQYFWENKIDGNQTTNQWSMGSFL